MDLSNALISERQDWFLGRENIRILGGPWNFAEIVNRVAEKDERGPLEGTCNEASKGPTSGRDRGRDNSYSNKSL